MSAVTATALCRLGWLIDVSCHCHSSVLAGVVDRCQLSLPQLCTGWLGG